MCGDNDFWMQASRSAPFPCPGAALPLSPMRLALFRFAPMLRCSLILERCPFVLLYLVNPHHPDRFTLSPQPELNLVSSGLLVLFFGQLQVTNPTF